MSSILKALEKVEEAQSGRRSGGAGGFVKARERRRPWVLPLGILGGAVVAAFATFAAMGGFARHTAQKPEAAPVVAVQPAAAPAPASVVPAAPAPKAVATNPAPVKAVSAPLAKQAAQGKAVKTVVAQHGKSAVSAKSSKGKTAPTKSAASAKAKSEQKSAKHEKSERKVAKSEQRKVARPEQKVAERSQPAPAPAPAVPAKAPVAAVAPPEKHHAPRVTGIAWQNDSASSVAMVNGRSVQQGATVDGYKVEQIFEDKVRFSSSNGRVEVPLGAGQ